MEFLSTNVFIIFAVILVCISFLYASVGHGGASGYLALMALFTFPIAIIKPTALLLNIFVSGISFWYFKKNKHFKWNLFYPFAITSIPAAFIGGYLTINTTLYKQILGAFLIIAVLRILGVFGKEQTTLKSVNLPLALVIGCGIGLFSGMIGIGGGIILSPIILLLAWGTTKESAAVSALFIFVNSLSGIVGFLLKNDSFPTESFYLIPFALVGGTLGAIYGSQKFSNVKLTYMLSLVLVLASIKLFMF
ncbi:sulfite exporter TauE/SafE family protein [Formosa sediminum]|uniref:Probable membrane transporter protein n=1 Tax=Formosa sediminum TaxID=2594004 RepID=A0A516GRA5_9FLAO|nr:sulfite exporter TauE/SafE family protein [Formosa sediminum]QDO93890.1 sulfite exporter TauE/SafE family protein [Formosa sediminum]